jgi:hypothetical protein
MMENTKRLMRELYDKPCEMYNVGAMIPYMNYRPRTLQEIIALERNETRCKEGGLLNDHNG